MPRVERNYNETDKKPKDKFRRRLYYKIIYGTFDFLGVIICTVCILVLFLLLTNMVAWFRGDIAQTFSSLQRNLTNVINLGE